MPEGFSSLSDLLAEQQYELSSPYVMDLQSSPSINASEVDGGNPSNLNAVIGGEFERSRPPSSLSRRLASITPPPLSPAMPTQFDFRALEYLPDYDSRLMCPICHVPLIEPIRLSCDHIFCFTCYETYRASSSRSNRDCCPSCRRELPLHARRDVPRMIVNMCNDIKAHCPFVTEGCQEVMARELVALHAARCPFEPVACPWKTCAQQTRRGDIDESRCLHELVSCQRCGIEVMEQDLYNHHKGDHADKCAYCEWWQSTDGVTLADHEAACLRMPRKCPGEDFGCKAELEQAELAAHEESCPFAVLKPRLKFTSEKIEVLESNLAAQKNRNEHLEKSCKRLWDIMKIHIAPMLDELRGSSKQDKQSSTPLTQTGQTSTSQSPSAMASTLSPNSPPQYFSFSQSGPHHPSISTLAPTSSQLSEPLNHLLSLHESLRNDVCSMNTRIDGITSSLDHFMASYTETESRANLMLLNDVSRIKEEFCHTNAALHSLRAQVTWLTRLNGMSVAGAGRQVGSAGGQNVSMDVQDEAEGPSNSIATNVSGPSSGGTRLPSAAFGRRLSDGHSSQERVKL